MEFNDLKILSLLIVLLGVKAREEGFFQGKPKLQEERAATTFSEKTSGPVGMQGMNLRWGTHYH